MYLLQSGNKKTGKRLGLGANTQNLERQIWIYQQIDSIDQWYKEHGWCIQHTKNKWDKVFDTSADNIICVCYEIG